MMRSPRGAGSMMRGITLSTEQEKALRSAQARHILATKPLMLEMMSARTDEQLARLNGDQKGLDAASARVTAARTKLDSLRSQRSPTSDLRAVLTPDQQKLLDKNLTERGSMDRMGRPGPMGHGRGGPGRMGPDGARGFRDGGMPPRAPRMRRWTEDADSTSNDRAQ
jgi:Spy/CpxP family protein refolding chaperone